MEEQTDHEAGAEPQEEIPRGQKFMDNIWLLLFLSLVISLVAYNAWGLVDLASVPWISP